MVCVRAKVEDPIAAQPRGVHLAAERFAEVRGNLMAVVQHGFCKGKAGFGVEHYEVGVLARLDGADLRREPGKLRRSG